MSPKAVFLREATGLVREWSLADGILYSIYYVGPTTAMGLAFAFGPVLFPGSNMLIGVLLGMVLNGWLTSVVYSMLGSAMPRSGGDYIYTSRLIHPAVGYTLTMGHYVFIDSFWNAAAGYTVSTMAVAPLFLFFGYLTGNKALLDGAVFFGTTIGILIVQLAWVLWSFYINVAGLRTYARFMRWTFPVFFIGLIAIAGLFMISREAFIQAFNGFMMTFVNVPNAYQGIIDKAVSSGWNPSPQFSWTATFGFLSIAAWGQMWPGWVTANYGEIKGMGTLRRSLTLMIGSQVFLAVYWALIAFLLVNSAGYAFLSSLGYLTSAGTSPLPLAPYFPVLATMLTTNPIVIFLALFGGLFLMAWAWCPNSCLGTSRVLLAMSFDRVLPSWFGVVNDRFHTPVRAIAFKSIMFVVFILGFDFVPALGGLLLGVVLSPEFLFLAIAIGAIVFPYRLRDVYKKSPASKYEVLGIPVISLLGVGMLIYTLYMIYLFLTVPGLGFVGSPITLAVLGALFLLSAIIYFTFSWYRKRQGIDIGLSFKEIPPE